MKLTEESIRKWFEENRQDLEFVESKIIKKTRYVYVKYNNKEGWTPFKSIQDGFNPKFASNKYTTETFKILLEKKYPHLELLEEYRGIKVKHIFFCKKCNEKFINTPDNILTSKYGCNTCYIKEKGKDRLRTLEEFNEIVFNLCDEEYSVLSEYNGSEEKILLKHNTCLNEFYMTPNNFIQGQRCPKCAVILKGLKRRKTHEEFVNDINKKYPNKYTILSEYEVQTKKIKVKYNDCGHENTVNPNSIFKGIGCLICANETIGDKKTKSKEQFEMELNLKFPNRFEILEYNKQSGEIKVLHKECNGIFYKNRGTDLLKNGSCSICAMSSLENTVKEVLQKYNIKFMPQKTFEDCKNIKILRFDFYLLDFNILIEAQGKQHYTVIEHFGGFSGFMERKFNDIRKKDFCKKNNIPLLEIPYWKSEFKQVETILKEHDII